LLTAIHPTAIVVVVAVVTLVCAAAPAQTGDVRPVHDPAVIKQGDWYYLFSTGGGLAVRRSGDLLHWDRIGSVFDRENLPAWAKAAVPGVKGFWAPDISFFNNKYHLYYSVSTFGSNRSAIGLATNTTLNPADKEYRWEDAGLVIASTPKETNWNAIDPNVVLDADGTPWLSFGSFWSGLRMCRLDPLTGKRPPGDTAEPPLVAGRGGGAIEAPFIVRKGDHFYLFVSFDICCRGAKSTYHVRVGRSKAVEGPYVDREGKKMTEGGGTVVLRGYGRFNGPGHNAVLLEPGGDRILHHFYDGEANGVPTLQVRALHWDDAGWPTAGDPIGAPTATTQPR
jgi:arabinan endo-1,5-alpha-L-arabinosidase